MFTTFKCPAVISRCYRIIVVIYADISHFCVGWLKARLLNIGNRFLRYLLPEMEKLAEAAWLLDRCIKQHTTMANCKKMSIDFEMV